MIRSRRLGLAAAVVVLGLTACGTANPSTSVAKNPAVIHVGASRNTGKGGAPTADGSMIPYQNTTYVFDGTPVDLGATGPAWSLPAGQQPDLARVQRIASLLGVKGEVVAQSADMGGGWRVGPDDGSAPTLIVSADGLLSWWFSPSAVSTPGSVGCASVGSSTTGSGGGTTPSSGGSSGKGSAVVPVPDTIVPPDAPTGSDPTIPIAPPPTTSPCDTPAPTPPVGVPTAEKALAAAKQLFADMGYDNASYQFDTTADQWSAQVTATLLLDGHRSPLSLSVGFGAQGAVVWASGTLATPQPAADYPLVGAEVGVQRLNDHTGKWLWFGGNPEVMRANGTGAANTGVAVDVATSIAGDVPPAAGAPGSSGSDVPTVAPPICPAGADCPSQPSVPIPEVTVHLTGVRLDITTLWAQDGTIWLLPAYTFTDGQGGQYTVIAVDEAYLDLPGVTVPVTTPDTTPVTTVPGDGTPPPTKPIVTVTLPGDVNPGGPVVTALPNRPTDTATVTS